MCVSLCVRGLCVVPRGRFRQDKQDEKGKERSCACCSIFFKSSSFFFSLSLLSLSLVLTAKHTHTHTRVHKTLSFPFFLKFVAVLSSCRSFLFAPLQCASPIFHSHVSSSSFYDIVAFQLTSLSFFFLYYYDCCFLYLLFFLWSSLQSVFLFPLSYVLIGAACF